MTCRFCKEKPVWRFTNKRQVCRKHFVQYVEKKILYTIRRFNMVKQAEILTIDKNDKRYDLLILVISELCEKRKELKKAESKTTTKKIMTSECLDDISTCIINEMIKGKIENLKRFMPLSRKFRKRNETIRIIIRPFYLLLESELELYAKFKNIEIKSKKKEENKTTLFINKLEKKHPEVKNAIVNSYLSIMERI